jgi:hypothetical protein
MNHERFDQLAKGLVTNRLSRREVLKSFVASAVVGVLPFLGGERAEAGTCKSLGRNCTANSQCCSKFCSGGVCRCKPEGRNCTANGQCCSKFCSGGQCRCKAVGKACANNKQCCSGKCENGLCRFPANCSTDPPTAASLAAAREALANGATNVKLSPQGCVRYHRTVADGRITHEATTFAGKPRVLWDHTATQSTGRRDLDFDGFSEWQATTQRGPTAPDSHTVISEFVAATEAMVRRQTYARTGNVVHTIIEEADTSGELQVVAEFDTGLKEEFAQSGESGTEIQPLATCSPNAQKKIQAAFDRAFNQGNDCLKGLGKLDLANAIGLDFALRDIKISCADLPSPRAAVVNSPEVRADPLVPVRITIDIAEFSALDDNDQASLVWHEMSHIELGPGSQNHRRTNQDADRVYGCEDICFDRLNATKCQCALCLETTSSDRRCARFNDCRFGENLTCPEGKICNTSTCQCEDCPPGIQQACGNQCCPPNQSCINGQCQEAPSKVFCNCNDTCYDDLDVCLAECKVTLGCFTAICRPAELGECP